MKFGGLQLVELTTRKNLFNGVWTQEGSVSVAKNKRGIFGLLVRTKGEIKLKV